jgi:hypothetical protein
VANSLRDGVEAKLETRVRCFKDDAGCRGDFGPYAIARKHQNTHGFSASTRIETAIP